MSVTGQPEVILGSKRCGESPVEIDHHLCDPALRRPDAPMVRRVEDMEWYNVPRPASGSLGKRILRECEVIFRELCAKCAPRHASG